jgi:asparagine synthetase B (glutamine-hydrolysing)
VPGMNLSMLKLQEKLTTESEEVAGLYEALRESTALRVKDIPPAPDIFIHRPHILVRGDDDVRLAILFSGGVDCTTLARIAHDVLPPDEPVDLLNVAFENARIIAAKNKSITTQGGMNGNSAEKSSQEDELSTQLGDSLPVDFNPYTLCPDRLTGLSSYRSLLAACPTRRFRFVQIDVPYTAVLSHRKTIIDLMAPHATEMDLSIALAFYFASRGNGTLLTSPASSRRENYTTQARTLLSGLGADELLGGYSRHSTAFRRSGYETLLAELQLDLHRLGKRNLGRDDRVAADWAKEMRYPFLDERVVAHCLSLPVTSKCPFADPVVDGEVENGKKVLRLLAQKLGLGNVAREAKRAVQFGARSAKMSVGCGNTKGTDFLIE